MSAFVALLRAVNVGGTGKLPMIVLRRLCEKAGFVDVETYIASGNVVFRSRGSEAAIQAKLGKALHAYAGMPIGVAVRTGAEMAAVLANNPFPAAAANRTVAIFLTQAASPDILAGVVGRQDEQLALGAREIYVHYVEGIAHSKLRIPAARDGTARNMKTVAKLAEMAARIAGH